MSLQPIDGNARGFQTITPAVTQKVAYTGTAAQSSAFAAGCSIVQLFSTTDAWIKFGSNPTATAAAGTSVFLPGGIIMFYGVTGGEKVSVIRDATSGSLHIVEGV